MAKTLNERFAELRPERRAKIEMHRQRMLNEIQAYRLCELREQRMLAQSEVADRILHRVEHSDQNRPHIAPGPPAPGVTRETRGR